MPERSFNLNGSTNVGLYSIGSGFGDSNLLYSEQIPNIFCYDSRK